MLKSIVNFFKRIEPISGVNCIMRLGLPGSGKTLDQTINNVLPHLLAGEIVYSSYWINWNRPNLKLFKEFDDIENVRNCVVVFDEIGQVLPARQWEEEGLKVQLFFQLHRHRHIDIIGNTQDVSLVAKTVGIVANKWYLCDNKTSKLFNMALKPFNLGYVIIRKTILSWQQLKKMANGWELEGIFPEGRKKDRHKTDFHSLESLEFNELDEFKQEIVHTYCPICQMRQGLQILKEDTLNQCDYNRKTKIYTLKEALYCPKHEQQPLEIRKSGIYDTDYEPKFPDKTITWRPLVDSPKGYTKIAYKGTLSDEQLAQKQELIRTNGLAKAVDNYYKEKIKKLKIK